MTKKINDRENDNPDRENDNPDGDNPTKGYNPYLLFLILILLILSEDVLTMLQNSFKNIFDY